MTFSMISGSDDVDEFTSEIVIECMYLFHAISSHVLHIAVCTYIMSTVFNTVRAILYGADTVTLFFWSLEVFK